MSREKDFGITDVAAYAEWMKLPEDVRKMLLANAFCVNCFVTSFAPGYAIRKDKYGLVIEGYCDKCGHEIARVCD